MIDDMGHHIARKRRKILDKPVPIDSVEKFAWVLFCKLKQKRELLKR